MTSACFDLDAFLLEAGLASAAAVVLESETDRLLDLAMFV